MRAGFAGHLAIPGLVLVLAAARLPGAGQAQQAHPCAPLSIWSV